MVSAFEKISSNKDSQAARYSASQPDSFYLLPESSLIGKRVVILSLKSSYSREHNKWQLASSLFHFWQEYHYLMRFEQKRQGYDRTVKSKVSK